MSKIKIVVNEVYEPEDDENQCLGFTRTTEIDYDKFKTLLAEKSFEFGYIEHILNAAIEGKTYIATSRKYSLSDTPEWFKCIETEAPDSAFDKVVTIEASLG